MRKLLLILPWFGILALVCLGASVTVTRQLEGPPNTITSAGQVVVFNSSNGFSTTNSSVVIDGFGNVSNVGNENVIQMNVSQNLNITNGLECYQRFSAPVVSDIGGTVGAATNYMLVNVNGQLRVYSSDGSTLYGPTILSP